MRAPPTAAPRGLAAAALGAFALSGFYCGFLLAVPVFTMEAFNRVLPTGNYATLAFLGAAAGLCAAAALAVDGARGELLVRVSARVDAALYPAAAAAAVERGPAGAEALRDADAVRAFLASPLASAVFDAPWSLVFLLCVFAIHPSLGWVALAAAASCGATVLAAALAGRAPRRAAAAAQRAGAAVFDGAWAEPHSVRAMGRAAALARAACDHRRAHVAAASAAAARQQWIEAAGRGARTALLLVAVGLALDLFLRGHIASGALVGVSLLFGRVTAALERLAYSGHGLALVWAAWARARRAAAAEAAGAAAAEAGGTAARGGRFVPPHPLSGAVELQGAAFSAPGRERPVLAPLDLSLAAGEVLLVVGPEGAGKSTLTRILAGAVAPTAGRVRMDGYDVGALDPAWLGAQIGFLPEDVEAGRGGGHETIAFVIARGDPDPDPVAVVAAARLVGAHAAIQALPRAYQTPVGPGHAPLSAGARQRLGLARAVYRTPALIVLDEPTAHLDAAGGTDLVRVVDELAAAGSAVVLVSRHPALAKVADRMIVLDGGRVVHEAAGAELEAYGRPRALAIATGGGGAGRGGGGGAPGAPADPGRP